MVYVVQEPSARFNKEGDKIAIDLSPALKFGQFRVLLEKADVVLSTSPTVDRLRRELKNFSDDDYLLLIGDPVAIGLAVTVACELNGGRVKILRWMRQARDYAIVQVDLRPGGARA